MCNFFKERGQLYIGYGALAWVILLCSSARQIYLTGRSCLLHTRSFDSSRNLPSPRTFIEGGILRDESKGVWVVSYSPPSCITPVNLMLGEPLYGLLTSYPNGARNTPARLMLRWPLETGISSGHSDHLVRRRVRQWLRFVKYVSEIVKKILVCFLNLSE